MQPLRILIADDHAIIREGLKMLLNSQSDLEVIGEAASGQEAFNRVCELRPDVVVMDISMPQLNGAQATKRIRDTCPNVKVLALSAYEDEVYVRQLLTLGASGYVLKRTAPAELAQAIRTVASGGTYLDPFVAGKVATNYIKTETGKLKSELSERESGVLRQIARGYSNKEIADQLCLSVKTVETYKARVCEKLELCSRADIVRYAIAQGWFQDQFGNN